MVKSNLNKTGSETCSGYSKFLGITSHHLMPSYFDVNEGIFSVEAGNIGIR